MAGFSQLFVIGGRGGFQGADGVNPIDLQILVGDGDRQWLEAHYFDKQIKPLGKVRIIVPAAPEDPDALLDAAIAFYPKHFADCPSLRTVESSIGDTERLDFNDGKSVPSCWTQLREEARPLFRRLNVYRAELVKLSA